MFQYLSSTLFPMRNQNDQSKVQIKVPCHFFKLDLFQLQVWSINKNTLLQRNPINWGQVIFSSCGGLPFAHLCTQNLIEFFKYYSLKYDRIDRDLSPAPLNNMPLSIPAHIRPLAVTVCSSYTLTTDMSLSAQTLYTRKRVVVFAWNRYILYIWKFNI